MEIGHYNDINLNILPEFVGQRTRTISSDSGSITSSMSKDKKGRYPKGTMSPHPCEACISQGKYASWSQSLLLKHVGIARSSHGNVPM